MATEDRIDGIHAYVPRVSISSFLGPGFDGGTSSTVPDDALTTKPTPLRMLGTFQAGSCELVPHRGLANGWSGARVTAPVVHERRRRHSGETVWNLRCGKQHQGCVAEARQRSNSPRKNRLRRGGTEAERTSADKEEKELDQEEEEERRQGW